MNDNLKSLFFEEAKELLSELESVLLQLEKNSEDNELIDRAFRALHTLKGSGGMFGFNEVSMFVHKIEAVYDKIRSKELSINHDIIRDTLRSLDIITYMLEVPTEKHFQDIADAVLDITTKFNSYCNLIEEKSIGEQVSKPKPIEKRKTYKIKFKPNDYLMLQGHNVLSLINEIVSLGKAIVVTKFHTIPDFDEFNPELLYTEWLILLNTDASLDAIKDIFIFVESDADLRIKKLSDENLLNYDFIIHILTQHLLQNNDITAKDIETINQQFNLNISESKELREKIITEKKLNYLNRLNKK